MHSSLLCSAAERVLFAIAKFLVLLHVLSASSRDVQIGTSYVRWGRKTCESSASLVYTGNTRKQTYIYFLCFMTALIYCLSTKIHRVSKNSPTLANFRQARTNCDNFLGKQHQYPFKQNIFEFLHLLKCPGILNIGLLVSSTQGASASISTST